MPDNKHIQIGAKTPTFGDINAHLDAQIAKQDADAAALILTTPATGARLWVGGQYIDVSMLDAGSLAREHDRLSRRHQTLLPEQVRIKDAIEKVAMHRNIKLVGDSLLRKNYKLPSLTDLAAMTTATNTSTSQTMPLTTAEFQKITDKVLKTKVAEDDFKNEYMCVPPTPKYQTGCKWSLDGSSENLVDIADLSDEVLCNALNSSYRYEVRRCITENVPWTSAGVFKVMADEAARRCLVWLGKIREGYQGPPGFTPPEVEWIMSNQSMSQTIKAQYAKHTQDARDWDDCIAAALWSLTPTSNSNAPIPTPQPERRGRKLVV